jgi:hypothetical protein
MLLGNITISREVQPEKASSPIAVTGKPLYVDGITSTAILYSYFKSQGMDISYRLPVGEDAYGLSIAAIDDFAKNYGSLLIPVDCGISNIKEIDYANTFQKIDSTLQNVQLLTNKLNSKDNTIGLLFNDASLYQNLNTTTANAASLLEDLQKSPKRYVHFSLFGKKDDR